MWKWAKTYRIHPWGRLKSWKMHTFGYSAKGVISVKSEKRGKRVALEKHIEMTKKIQNNIWRGHWDLVNFHRKSFGLRGRLFVSRWGLLCIGSFQKSTKQTWVWRKIKNMLVKRNWKKFNFQSWEIPRFSNKYPSTTPILAYLSPLSLFFECGLFEVDLDLLARVWPSCFTSCFTSHLTSESSNCACLLRMLQLLSLVHTSEAEAEADADAEAEAEASRVWMSVKQVKQEWSMKHALKQGYQKHLISLLHLCVCFTLASLLLRKFCSVNVVRSMRKVVFK